MELENGILCLYTEHGSGVRALKIRTISENLRLNSCSAKKGFLTNTIWLQFDLKTKSCLWLVFLLTLQTWDRKNFFLWLLCSDVSNLGILSEWQKLFFFLNQCTMKAHGNVQLCHLELKIFVLVLQCSHYCSNMFVAVS